MVQSSIIFVGFYLARVWCISCTSPSPCTQTLEGSGLHNARQDGIQGRSNEQSREEERYVSGHFIEMRCVSSLGCMISVQILATKEYCNSTVQYKGPRYRKFAQPPSHRHFGQM